MLDSRRAFIKKTAAATAFTGLPLSQFSSNLHPTIRDAGMELCMSYFFGFETLKMQYAHQMGVSGAITGVGTAKVGLKESQPWEFVPLKAIRDRFEAEGLQWKVVEGPPTLEKTKLGLDGRDEEIDHFITFLKNIGQLGIRIVCYNWMPVISWHRTTVDRQGRGGALMTAFDYEAVEDQELTQYGIISHEQMWDNLAYFLKAIIPEAEQYGVRLAMHPDDPPIPELRGIARIMTSVEAFKRMLDLYPSDSNSLCFCQGSFATMGADIPAAIRYFGKRDAIAFIHFRDIRGDKYNFEETFHDEGITDMYKAMKTYYEVGATGPIRPDHVPTMAGDSNEHPGYSVLGNLYAIGYMRGLIEAVEKQLV